MSGFISCDCCGRLTNRLHHGFTCGTEYNACDECCDYDADAYGEAPAEYLDPDRAREDDLVWFRQDELGRPVRQP